MSHVLILAHRHDTFERERYVLREVAAEWREQGFRVTVAPGPDQLVEADVVVLHVDLTAIPAEYVAFLRRYPRVVNGSVTDISKRTMSRQLVRRGDGYAGPAIVKTDRNSGGSRERRLNARLGRRGWPARRLDRLRNRPPWGWRSHLDTGDYRVFDSVSQVPRAVWLNGSLVVERFLPERRDEHFCLRTWVFFGDRETNAISYAAEPIIKSQNVLRREPLAEVPDELRAMRRKLGFDFGKFDYGIVDACVVLYDANRTPMFGSMRREDYWSRLQLLAEGIRGFL